MTTMTQDGEAVECDAKMREYADRFGALMDSVICRPWGHARPSASPPSLRTRCEWCNYPWRHGVEPDGFPVCIACAAEPCEGPVVETCFWVSVVHVNHEVSVRTVDKAAMFALSRIETDDGHTIGYGYEEARQCES